jgi:Hypoxia induced protein conserved region
MDQSLGERPEMTGQVLVVVSVTVVALVLMAGLYTLWIGGETSRNWSNRLMRIRVLAQFIAIIIIMSVLYFSSH